MGLEWVAAELAAENASPEDLAELAGLLDQADALVEGGSLFTDAASAFHEGVARAAHNWAIETSLRAVREVLREMHVRHTTGELARRVMATHRAIFDAIQARDAAQAGQLMRAHISATRASATANERD
jgi:GntR family transcriptional repressor for pyruvate dehydrogenase complex